MADTTTKKAIKKINGLRIKLRTDVEKNWKASNPILLKGEFAYISDKKQFMIGDGIKHMFIDTSKGINECLELAGGGEALIARSLIGVAQYEKNDDGTDKVDENGNKIIATDANGNVIYDAAKINGVTFDGTEDIEINKFKAGIAVTGRATTDELKVDKISNFYDNVTITGGDLVINSSSTEGGVTKGGALQVAGTSNFLDAVDAANGVTIAVKKTTETKTVDDGNGGKKEEVIDTTGDALTVTGTSQFNGSIEVTGTDSTITGNLANSIKFVTTADDKWSTTTSADGEETLNTDGTERTVFEYNNNNTVKIPVNDKEGFLLLDKTAKIPNWALPGSIDEIKSYTDPFELPIPGVEGKIYFVKNAHKDSHDLDKDDNKEEYISAVYRWAGLTVSEDDAKAYLAAKEAYKTAKTAYEKAVADGDTAAQAEQKAICDAQKAILENLIGIVNGEVQNGNYVEINSSMGTADKAHELLTAQNFSINNSDKTKDIYTTESVLFNGTKEVDLQVELKDLDTGAQTYTVDPADAKTVNGKTTSQYSVGEITTDAKGRVTKIDNTNKVLITPKWSSIVETSADKGLDVAAATGKATEIAADGEVRLATWDGDNQYISNKKYTGNAATASALDHNHVFKITGDAEGTGSSNLTEENAVNINLILKNTSVTAKEYGIANTDGDGKHYVPTITVDAKGRITAADEQLLKWTDLKGVDNTEGKADGSVYNKGLTIQAKDRIATWQYLLKNETTGKYEEQEGYIDAIKYTGVAAAADTLNIDDFVYIFDCGDSTDNVAQVTDTEEKTMEGSTDSATDSDMTHKVETSSSQTTTTE